MTKSEWMEVFQPAYNRAMTVKTIQNSFRGTGIYPKNRAAITDKDLSPSAPADEESVDYYSDSECLASCFACWCWCWNWN